MSPRRLLSARVADCETRLEALLRRAIDEGELSEPEVAELNAVVATLIEVRLLMSGRPHTLLAQGSPLASHRLH